MISIVTFDDNNNLAIAPVKKVIVEPPIFVVQIMNDNDDINDKTKQEKE